MRRVETWRVAWLGLLVGLLVTTGTARAQAVREDTANEDTRAPAAVPLVIVNAASVERLLGDLRYMFEAAGQPQINEMITSGIAGANDLKGLDRTKPLGLMIFLAPGIPPRPFVVGYVPVKNIDELTQTIAGGERVQLKKVENEVDRYELVGRQGNQQILLRGGYAYISSSAENLDRKFLNPAKLTSGLSSRHDIAVTLKLNTVPEAVKNILAGTLRAQFNASMQQRNDEPDGPYQLRRAQEGNTLEFIELLLSEGEQITLGINASKEKREAVFEFQFDAKPDGKWARSLKDIGSRPSYFAPLLDEKAPLSFSLSWKMDKREKGNLTEFLRVAEPQVVAQLESVAPAVHSLFAALNRTADNGHADAFFQYKMLPQNTQAIYGGIKVVDGTKLSAAARSILNQLKQNPDIGEIEIDVDSHNNVSFHRISGRPGRPGAQTQNGQPRSLYIGTGPKAVWFAAGNRESLNVLKQSIDQLANTKARVTDRPRKVPFQFVLNMTQWLDSMNSERPFTKIARAAFKDGRDRLQVDIRPTDNGLRMQIRVEEGFLKMFGTAIGQGISGRQERIERRRRQREQQPTERRP